MSQSNGRPAPDLNSTPGVVVASSVDEHSGIRAVEFAPVVQTAHHVPGDRLARFDFDRVETLAVFNEEIDLVSLGIPPVVQRRFHSSIEAGLTEFGNDVGLEDRAALAVQFQIPSRPDAQQIAKQSGIIEIQLRRFDQALVEIPGAERETES